MRNTVEAMENNISQLVDSIINMPRRERESVPAKK